MREYIELRVYKVSQKLMSFTIGEIDGSDSLEGGIKSKSLIFNMQTVYIKKVKQ
jgi:hypothetical protein